jgi:hypothetical protein
VGRVQYLISAILPQKFDEVLGASSNGEKLLLLLLQLRTATLVAAITNKPPKAKNPSQKLHQV